MTPTKTFKRAALFFSILSFCLAFGPLLAYCGIALATSTTAAPILMSCIGVATIFSFVAVINKYTPRCIPWIVMIGLYFALEHFIPCLLVLAATQIVDELIICPLKRHYWDKYSINKEIDKRIP